MSVDEFKGNVLEFYYDSVNPVVKQTIPRNVFQELRGRYGNVYYMKETGAESVSMIWLRFSTTSCLLNQTRTAN